MSSVRSTVRVVGMIYVCIVGLFLLDAVSFLNEEVDYYNK